MQTSPKWTVFGVSVVVAILYSSLIIWLFSSGSNPLPYWSGPLIMSIVHFIGLDLIVECVLMKRPLKALFEATKTMGIPSGLGTAIATLFFGFGEEESAILAVLISVGIFVVSVVGFYVRLKRIEKKMRSSPSP